MNAEQVLIIGSVDCNDQVNTRLVSWSLGKPQKAANEDGGPGVLAASVGPVDSSGLVESRFLVEISGSSVDEVMAVVSSISKDLDALSPITVGLKNSAHLGTMTPKICQYIEIDQDSPWDNRLVLGNVTQIEIIVRRDPAIRTPAEVLASAASYALPGVIDLSAQSGNMAAELDLLFDFAALEANALYVGHTADESAVIGDFVKPLGAGTTWVDVTGTGAAAADAAGWPDGAGSTIYRTAGSSYTDVDVTGYDGEYLVLVKVKGTTANTDFVRHAYCDNVPIPTTTLHWLPLGRVKLPAVRVRGGAASTLRLTIAGGDGSEYAAINAVAFLPSSSGGVVGWHRPSGHAHAVASEDGMVYADDVATADEAVGGLQLLALGGRLVAVADQVTAHPTTAVAATVTDEPRWEQLPTSGTIPGPSM